MAVTNVYIFAFLAALVAVKIIFAEESYLEHFADESYLEQNEFDFNQVEAGESFEREARSPTEELLLSLLGISTRSCNFTTATEESCLSCRHALTCYSNNRSLVRTCSGFLPYCNRGRCSFIPGAKCNSG